MNKYLKKTLSFLLAFSLIVSAAPQDFVYDIRVNAAGNTKGDVNKDGKINIVDVIKLKSYICENNVTNISEDNSDLDGDQKISAIDYSEITEYILGKIHTFGSEILIDSDADGLFDKLELHLKTDPNKSDTDGDKFTDYQEIFLLNSDPLKADTKLGEKDPDNDSLTNAEEIELGTNLFSADSDNDKLSDYDEVKKYKTDPLNKDTDGDSLPDYFEIENGTDPLSEKSDGKTYDQSKIFRQKISDSVFSELNETEKYAYFFSAQINASGYGEENFKVVKSAYSDFLANRYISGDILDTSYENGKIQDITVSFRVKSNASDYCIFKYSEEYNTLLPVETEYKDNVLSYTDQECGTYCILNVQSWIKGSEFSSTPIDSSVSSPVAASVGNEISNMNNVYDNSGTNQGIDIYFFKYFPESLFDPKIYTFDEECMDYLEFRDDFYRAKKFHNEPSELLAGYITQILKEGENKQKDIHVYGIDETGNLGLSSSSETMNGIPYVSNSSSEAQIKSISGGYVDNFGKYTYVNYNAIGEEYPNNRIIRRPYSLAGALWSTPA